MGFHYAYMEVKQRHVLRKKEAKKILQELEKNLSCSLTPQTVEIVKSPPYEFLLLDGELHALILNNQAFLSLRGIIAYHPHKKWVTIDMGAVTHIANGADVMAPGILDADPDIRGDDMVWIRDEKNNQPLAIGTATMNGLEMIKKSEGKAVKVLHHVGDAMWKIGESL